MALFLLCLLCVVLSGVCWQAIVLYRRIPDFLPTRADGESGCGSIRERDSKGQSVACVSCNESLASRLTQPTGVQDHDAWRHYERMRRMATRLDVIVMQPVNRQEKTHRIAGPSSWARGRARNLLRGVWLTAILAVIIGSLLPSDTA